MSSSDGSTVIFRRAPAGLRRKSIERFRPPAANAKCAKGRAFDCLITGDAELRRLNREFRGKDYATDVLSFPGRRRHRPKRCCAANGATRRYRHLLARARAQARRFGHTTGTRNPHPDAARRCCTCWAWITKATAAGWRAPRSAGARGWACRPG